MYTFQKVYFAILVVLCICGKAEAEENKPQLSLIRGLHRETSADAVFNQKRELWVYTTNNLDNYKTFSYGNCTIKIYSDKEYLKIADFVIINAHSPRLETFENMFPTNGQVWIMQILESPVHTKDLSLFDDKINYTASYHRDSDLVTPYGYFLEKTPVVDNLKPNGTDPDKPEKAVFVASNCWTSNARIDLVNDMGKHYHVDTLGGCFGEKVRKNKLQLQLASYKYFLAFENSNCEDYITEKVFTAFRHNLVPIVYGAPKKAYTDLLPKNSFIYLQDFASLQELAGYLKKLDQNSTLYNDFFSWKLNYIPVDFNLYYSLCFTRPPNLYHSVNAWWQNKTCETQTLSSIFSKSNK